MRKKAATLLAALLGVVWMLASAWSQDDMTHVDRDVFPDARRPAAVFAHDDHNEAAGIEACDECHHVYEDGRKLEGESSEDQRCADCHGLEASDGEPSLLRAFHGNCKGCHLERAQGPFLCGECHRRH